MERLQRKDKFAKMLVCATKKRLNRSYAPHFHNFYEIEYVISGEGTYTVNGKPEACAPGMLFFITPVDYHSVQSVGAEIFNVMFSEQLVDFRELEPFLRDSAPKAVTVPPEDRPFFEEILRQLTENENDAPYCSALMRCLLLKLARFFSKPAGSRRSDALTKIHAYVINHYRERISLETAAAYAGLTPSYVSALFKKEMQTGFKAYLNSLRLEYARKLLLYTEQPVKQICEESGFEDVPNFIKRFKEFYGMTPTVLRREKCGIHL